MLNADTKRRINACRDILVGKVTDPKAQVEQITIALMYKFMNDMDHEVRDLGGASSFFAGEFATYSWDRITDPRLGGEERLRLYAEGIEAVVKNPGVPELFRQIFRNAYLPYRDPETFNLFSQEISGFRYEHSEDLGDAFEYLLSVMQSQGDAGQFRTPRHIIDFMVEVVKPQPGEAILDPACGTAGFLISAYKHIVKHHQLTPAQTEDLHRNVEGYDISPDMVRLSRVNLYLHQFADPRVVEYDTLTSEDRWGRRFDVILANPPFMTPKGGIRPHRKFSLESNRSEVLFVDYIAEHLMAGGRAAVIVPEGIIFQSGKAYQQLRRMLVESSLWAVVSLPAGVFNPYSGVKTSILFLDRGIAEKGAPVLFAQVKADGYDLGAQRRAVAANDLPAALALLNDAHTRLSRGEVPADFRDSLTDHALTHLFVPRAVLAEGDANLSGERYRVAAATGPKKWPMVKLGEVCDLLSGQHIDTEKYNSEGVGTPYLTGPADFGPTYPLVSKWTTEPKVLANAGDILITVKGSGVGKVNRLNLDATCISRQLMAIRPREIEVGFLYALLQTKFEHFQLEGEGAAIPGLTRDDVLSLEIPLPPLSVQQQIVAEVARYQAVIDGARQVVDHWKPSFAVEPEWPVVKLGEVAIRITKGTTPTTMGFKYHESGVAFVKIEALSETGEIDRKKLSFVGTDCHEAFSRSQLATGDVLFSIAGTEMGITAIVTEEIIPANTNQALAIIRLGTLCMPRYALNFLRSPRLKSQIEGLKTGVAQFNLSLAQVSELEIPLPPLEVQQQIVQRIEAERELVEANKRLIELMKARIDETMARVWG
ncbi:MAG: N-6 DNA methylase [Spirochaetales bacterium]